MTISTTKWWVYILLCADGSLYTGATTDLARRFRQHNTGTASKYTRCRRPVELAYRQSFPNQSKAFQREAAIKSLTRNAKETLIERQNQAKRKRRSLKKVQ